MKLKYKEIEDNNHELWLKILIGDISDNIQPCYIKKELINTDSSKKSKKNILKCTKRNISKFVTDKEFINKLLNNPDLIENQQHLKNRNLIDFDYIPKNITEDIIKEFTKVYN